MGEAVVIGVYQQVTIHGVGQGFPQSLVFEQTAFGVTADVEEDAVFAVPKFVVAAVVGVAFGAGVGAHQTHFAKLKCVTNLVDILRFLKRNGAGGKGQLSRAPPFLL